MNNKEIKEILKIVSNNVGISGNVNFRGIEEDLESLQSNSVTDNQIETIADLFSRRECLVVEGQDTEWLLSHAFQLGMKAYRDLFNCA